MSTATPLVSIIIPTYNRAHLIGETLDSVLAQTYQNWECIVVDDGSTDNTDDVLAQYLRKDSRFQYYHRPTDRLPGGNAARNYGFELSRGDFIQWFDSDDLMTHEYISARIFSENNTYEVLIINGRRISQKGILLKHNNLKNHNNLYTDYVLKNSEILTPGIMFKRRCLEGYDLFCENMLRSQEVEFFSRFFFEKKDLMFSVSEKIGYLYRFNQNSKSNQDKKYVSNYKLDHFKVHSINWLRGKATNNLEVQKHCAKRIVDLLFQSYSNDDKITRKKIFCFLKENLSFLRNIIFRCFWGVFSSKPRFKYRIKRILIKLLLK